MAAQNSGIPAAAAPGDQSQPGQTSGGQPDYTKAWEEYYKKMAMGTSVCMKAPSTCTLDKNEVTCEVTVRYHT